MASHPPLSIYCPRSGQRGAGCRVPGHGRSRLPRSAQGGGRPLSPPPYRPLYPPPTLGLYTPLPAPEPDLPSHPTPPYPPKVAGDAGVDVVVDMVGGELLDPCVRSLNWGGRCVVVGFASGSIPKAASPRAHQPERYWFTDLWPTHFGSITFLLTYLLTYLLRSLPTCSSSRMRHSQASSGVCTYMHSPGSTPSPFQPFLYSPV